MWQQACLCECACLLLMVAFPLCTLCSHAAATRSNVRARMHRGVVHKRHAATHTAGLVCLLPVRLQGKGALDYIHMACLAGWLQQVCVMIISDQKENGDTQG